MDFSAMTDGQILQLYREAFIAQRELEYTMKCYLDELRSRSEAVLEQRIADEAGCSGGNGCRCSNCLEE